MLMHFDMQSDPLLAATQRISLAPIINMESTVPRQTSEKWHPQDDQKLMNARAQGLNWAPIQQKYFPTKTPNACRKRHERLMEKRSAEDWSPEDLEALGREYSAIRKEMWSMLSARLTGQKWQVVEKKCLEKGLKNLQAAGRAASRRDRAHEGNESTFIGNDTVFEPDDEEETRQENQRTYEDLGPRHKRARTSHDMSSFGALLHPTS